MPENRRFLPLDADYANVVFCFQLAYAMGLTAERFGLDNSPSAWGSEPSQSRL